MLILGGKTRIAERSLFGDLAAVRVEPDKADVRSRMIKLGISAAEAEKIAHR